ncbi:hypothetical protein EC988_002303, partial [Linderina pennispora]
MNDGGDFEHGSPGSDTDTQSYLIGSDGSPVDTPQLSNRRLQDDPQMPAPAGKSRRSSSRLSRRSMEGAIDSPYPNSKTSSKDFDELLKGDLVIANEWSAVGGGSSSSNAKPEMIERKHLRGVQSNNSAGRSSATYSEGTTASNASLAHLANEKQRLRPMDQQFQDRGSVPGSAMPQPMHRATSLPPNAPGEAVSSADDRNLRSAMRVRKPTPPGRAPGTGVPNTTARKVTFTGVPQPPSTDSPLREDGREPTQSPDNIQPYSDGSLGATLPPWEEQPARHFGSIARRAQSMSVDLGRTISIDGTGVTPPPSSQGATLRHRRSGSLEAAHTPNNQTPPSPTPQANTWNAGFSGTFIGVGIIGNAFSKVNTMLGHAPLSPRTAARAMSPTADMYDKRPGSRAMSESEANTTGGEGGFDQRLQRKASDNFDSTISTSSVSPLRTEPMRSNAPSNFNTPHRNMLGLSGFTPASALRKTPGSAVNPLARHLAMKSIQSSQKGTPFMSRSVMTPTPGNKSTAPFMSPLSSGDISDASMMDVADIQKQLEQFAELLKSDNSVAQAELLQSEEAWVEMQREIARLTTELAYSEDEREAMHAQMGEMHRERADMDADRQQLEDRCSELTDSIQQWQRRIGDVENDRQGVWKEGQQSRAELLNEIIRGEDRIRAAQAETAEVREKARAAVRSTRSQVLAECEGRMATLREENGQLRDHLAHAEAGYEMVTGENRRLEADVHEARLMAKEAAERAAAREMELTASKRKAALAEQQVQALEKQVLELSETAREAQATEIALRTKIQDNAGTIRSLGETINDQTYEIKVLKTGHREGSTEYETAMELLSPERKQSVSSRSEDIAALRQKFQMEIKRLKSDNELLTEQLRELVEAKGSSSDRDATQAIAVEKKHSLAGESKAMEKLKQQHRDEVEQFKSQIEMLKEQLEDLIDSKGDYKKQCAELMDMAEAAKSRITGLEADVAGAAERESTLRQQLAAKSETAHTNVGSSDDVELEMLRETEERLAQELEVVERENAELSERARNAEERSKRLAARNDELSQRTARLETEISDMQLRLGEHGVDPTKDKEIETLHRTLSDLEKELAARHNDNDRLRQELAKRDIEFDEMQADLVRVRQEHEAEIQALKLSEDKIVELRSSEQKLKAELKELSTKLARTSGVESVAGESVAEKTANSSSEFDNPEKLVHREFELSHSLRRMQSDVAALEIKVERTKERRGKLEREERFLTDQLVNNLLRNKTLRFEAVALLMRRAGKLRELKALQSQYGNDSLSLSMSDEGSVSMMSGDLNDIPTASQLLDGSRPMFLNTLDEHLEEMEVVMDKSDTMSQRSIPTTVSRSSPLRRTISQPTERREASRVLTPIREENAAQSHPYKDAAVQCTLDSEAVSALTEQLEIELDSMRGRMYQLEDDCKTLRTNVAEVKQERDQFKVSHEDASEHVSKLTGQIEDLSEEHERMRAENITTARISRRLARQLSVLKRILGRLALYDSQVLSKNKDEQPSADDKEREEVLALEEDDAMINATLDRPLGTGDDEVHDASDQENADRLASQGR